MIVLNLFVGKFYLNNYWAQRAVSRAMRAVSGGWDSPNLQMLEVSKDKKK